MDLSLFLLTLKLFSQLIHSSDTKVCDTPGCQRLSRYLHKLVNTSADPCDNFYEFACGQFIAMAKNETALAVVSVDLATRQLIVNATLYGLAGVNLKNKTVPKAFKYARRYFDACVDYDASDDSAQEEVVNFLVQFENWPFLNKTWESDSFDVVKLVGKLQGELSLPTLVSLTIDVDKLQNSRYTLYLKEGSLIYDVIQYNETVFPEFKDQYTEVIFKALQQLTINTKVTHHNVKSLRKIAREIVEFEADIASNIIPETQVNEDDITKYYHPYTLSELNNVYNSSSVWNRYFQAALSNNSKHLAWLTENKIVVTQLPYYQFLAQKFRSTPREVIANYLMWRTLAFLGPYFDQNFLQVGLTAEERKLLRRRKLNSDKPKLTVENADCLEETMAVFEHVAGRIYVESRYSATKHRAALNLTDQILKASRKIFEDNQWLSKEAKMRIFAKMDNLVTNIGFPEWIFNDTLLNEYYAAYRIRSNYSYFRSQMAFKRFSLDDLFELVDRHRFLMPVTQANNAAYFPVTNALTVPAGQLEYPFFDPEYPDFYNIAVVGETMGHEIFHGFDNTGSLYDANGNATGSILLNSSWLLADSAEKFSNLTDCLVLDYNQYCYQLPNFTKAQLGLENGEEQNEEQNETQEEISPLFSNCVDGEKTLGENIADLDGIKAAYTAYRNVYEDRLAPTLKGFERFTQDQMFFTSYATSFCAHLSSNLKVVETYLTDEHSPNDARVNALLRNIPEFRDAFKCRPDSYMFSNNNNGYCTLY